MSTVKPTKYTFNPTHIDAIQVTADNMEFVAKWCGGEIKMDGQTILTPYISVTKVNRPMTERQKMAFVDDWVTLGAIGWKVYTDKAFKKTFSRFVEAACGLQTHTIDQQPCVLGKGHRQGAVVTGCRSLQDYKVHKMDDVLDRLGYSEPMVQTEPWQGISDEMATTPIAMALVDESFNPIEGKTIVAAPKNSPVDFEFVINQATPRHRVAE